MEYQIRAYVDELFQSAPHTQQAYELKVELTQNLLDKYNALLAEGRAPEEAYNQTVMSIGDVGELFQGLAGEEPPAASPMPQPAPQAQDRNSRAAVVTIAVMLYILSVVPLIGLTSLFGEYSPAPTLGVIIMFVMIACATGLLIYHHMTRPPKAPVPSTMVEDFKQWQAGKSQKKRLLRAIRSAYWPLVLAFYFLISFGTHKWYITWIIFLIAPGIDGIISAVLTLQEPNQRKGPPMP